MKKTLFAAAIAVIFLSFSSIWGFFAHQTINRLAVFTLPAPMNSFYKHHIKRITGWAINADKRRYAVPEEAPRHYIDADHFGASGLDSLPRTWAEAVSKYGEDTLQAHGVLPWHLRKMYDRLRYAFMTRDAEQIIKISADLGHYIGDAHVPLHTTQNYNGQLTGQDGIHGFWESRLPELFSDQYDFTVGRAIYITDIEDAIWKMLEQSHNLVDDVLALERELAIRFQEKKFSFDTRGNMTVKVYSLEYSKAYHRVLEGMVERQMRAAILMTGRFWYTAWVDAGQPDIRVLITEPLTEIEIQMNRDAIGDLRPKREHEH